MPSVQVRENEPFEIALRRFKRGCEKAGILTETRRREFYEKPTAMRKRKIAAAKIGKAKKKRLGSTLTTAMIFKSLRKVQELLCCDSFFGSSGDILGIIATMSSNPDSSSQPRNFELPTARRPNADAGFCRVCER